MEKNLIKYFQDGITIDKLPNGKYSVFTPKTQRFVITSLDNLTPETFDTAIKDQKSKSYIKEEPITDYTEKIPDNTIEEAMSYHSSNVFYPKDFTYHLFNTIVNEPSQGEVTVSGGKKMSVGPKFKLVLLDDTEYEIYITQVDRPHRTSLIDSKVMFIIGYNGAFQIFTIREMTKRFKRIEKIL